MVFYELGVLVLLDPWKSGASACWGKMLLAPACFKNPSSAAQQSLHTHLSDLSQCRPSTSYSFEESDPLSPRIPMSFSSIVHWHWSLGRMGLAKRSVLVFFSLLSQLFRPRARSRPICFVSDLYHRVSTNQWTTDRHWVPQVRMHRWLAAQQ